MRDIQTHWARPCIERLIEQTIVSGYPDGSFRPDQPVNRAEFAALLAKAFPLPPNRPAIRFSDVPERHWAAEVITMVYRAGWLSGYPGGRFRPFQAIAREEVLVALTAGLGILPENSPELLLSRALSDAEAISAYARAALAAAITAELMVNYPDARRFRARQSASRGEVAAFLCQAIARASQQPSPVPFALIARATAQEVRGVWLTNVDSEVLFSKAALTAALDRLAAHHFNTLYPTVWNWGYTLFPSAVAARTFGYAQGLYPDTENRGRNTAAEAAQGDRDMLLELMELARDRTLAVMPWFEFGLLAPADSPLAQRHPDWLSARADGSTVEVQDHGKYRRVWLNPFHPEVQQFLVDLVSELSANYPIDGFQLDDHFGLPVSFGYDATTRALYQQATGRQPPRDPQEPGWMRWRADQITALMQRLFHTLKRHRPRAIFSVSPSPAAFAYSHYLQDWPAWERQGYVEELVVQIYRRNLPSFETELERPELVTARGHIPTVIGILSGLKNEPMPSSLVQAQVQASRQRGYGGVCFFFYESIWQGEPMATREAMVRSLFSQPASRPEPTAP